MYYCSLCGNPIDVNNAQRVVSGLTGKLALACYDGRLCFSKDPIPTESVHKKPRKPRNKFYKPWK